MTDAVTRCGQLTQYGAWRRSANGKWKTGLAFSAGRPTTGLAEKLPPMRIYWRRRLGRALAVSAV